MNHFNKPFRIWPSAVAIAVITVSLLSCLTTKSPVTAVNNTVQPLDSIKTAQTSSSSAQMPEENRFVKTILVNDLNEPMELAVAKDGSVLYAERKGKIWYYNAVTGKPSLVWNFDVVTENGFGVLGFTIDPDFLSNKYVYVFYSPIKEKYKHYISRFTLNADNTIDPASEKVLIQIPVEMESSFHHGGSLAFDKDKNLVIATGDNTGASAYAPIDERAGRLTNDAQRSAGNTNDLRGKMLRIHPEADGTYTIPQGNLFPVGTAGTRPEIYVMGVRNPYRMTVNARTSSVYWGEVGPDAGNDGKEGPKGYDEFNQAKKAGNFGWPYFIGNNQPYNHKDFATNTFGAPFNAAAPVNNSPNNTGLKNLPPAQKATVWYPYALSPDFKDMGLGGRCAIAGEIYNFNKNSSSAIKFPEYFDNGWIVFDWIRNWAKVIRFDENENYVSIESFMPKTGDFRRPMDAAFGQDGSLYVLEYGSIYGIDNDDARLVKIEYNAGNRKPVAIATASDSIGVAPFKVSFSSSKTFDYDKDKLSYEWLFDGKTVGSTEANPTFTYSANGVYSAILKVTDKAGAIGRDTIEVKVGNTLPEIAIELNDNKTFYWSNTPLKYEVKITDKEDGKIDPKMAKVYFDYYSQPVKQAIPPAGHQPLPTLESNSLGESLISNSDCKACHTLDKITVGPSFTAIAQRYKGDAGAPDRLGKKIINGGSGVWGEHSMSAHPQLTLKETTEMAKYILSIAEGKKQRISLPLQGNLNFNIHTDKDNGIYSPNGKGVPTLTGHGKYTLIASYTDKGGSGVGPLTNSKTMTFRSAKLSPLEADDAFKVNNWKNVLKGIGNGSYFLFKNIDLTNIRQVTYYLSSEDRDAQIEIHLDSPNGPLISTAPFKATGSFEKKIEVSAPVTPTTGKHDVYFVASKKQAPNNNLFMLDWIQFKRN